MGWDFLIARFKLSAQRCFFYFIKFWFEINLVHLFLVVGATRIFLGLDLKPHVCAVRVGSCRIVQRIRVKNVRGVEIKEPTCVPLPPTQRYYHKKNTKVLLLTCGWMICEAAFSRTGTSTNTNSKHSPSTTQTLTCLPWQGGQKLMTIIYPISDKVVNCNHLNGQPQQYLSICLSSSENYISTKFHYTACIMLLLVTTCEGSWRHGCLSKVPKYDSPDWWFG